MSIELKQAAQQALEALIEARRYVVGAYECAFPDRDLNESVIRQIDETVTAIQQAEAKTDEPVAWISKTGHGTYFRQSITPELSSLEHGGNKMWRPLVYGDTHPAPGVPDGYVLVPVERSYDQRAKALIAFNRAEKDGKDRDDALQAAWDASLTAAQAQKGQP